MKELHVKGFCSEDFAINNSYLISQVTLDPISIVYKKISKHIYMCSKLVE